MAATEPPGEVLNLDEGRGFGLKPNDKDVKIRGIEKRKFLFGGMMPEFDKHERAILQILHQYQRPLSKREIGVASGMSYATISKYLYNLNRRGFVTKTGIKWEINSRVYSYL